eukprot:c34722_g1_i1 orf=103-342(+)
MRKNPKPPPHTHTRNQKKLQQLHEVFRALTHTSINSNQQGLASPFKNLLFLKVLLMPILSKGRQVGKLRCVELDHLAGL